jgi:hypothetical protein
MDLSWIPELKPAQIIVWITGITAVLGCLAALLALAKHLGLAVTKEGLSFRTSEKMDAVLEIVKDIQESDGRQEAEIKRLGDEVGRNTKDTLRLTFYNEALSPAERLAAGKRYLDAGGNGETEKAVNDLIEKHPEIWQGILAVRKAV